MTKNSVEDVKNNASDPGNVVIVVVKWVGKLEQNFFMFNQLRYMTKDGVKVVKKMLLTEEMLL